jgi:hypothetical protein
MITPNTKERIAALDHDDQDALMQFMIDNYARWSPARQEVAAGIACEIYDAATEEVGKLNAADATLLRLLERQATAGTDFCDLDPATLTYLLQNSPEECWAMLGETDETLLGRPAGQQG